MAFGRARRRRSRAPSWSIQVCTGGGDMVTSAGMALRRRDPTACLAGTKLFRAWPLPLGGRLLEFRYLNTYFAFG